MCTRLSKSLESHFFTHLPYDVRANIYSYLESGDLPPFAPKFQCPNYLLSCRKAKQEIEEIASIRLSQFLESFQQSTSVELHTQPDPHNQRNLTVILPFTALYSLGQFSGRLGWGRKSLVSLHPLLSQYFDTLRIHIAGDPNLAPPHASLLERGKLETYMHSLLRDLGYMIEHVNRVHRNPDLAPSSRPEHETMFYYQDGDRKVPYPSAKVAVKRVCLSWDLRASRDHEVELNGKLHHAHMFRADSTPPHHSFFPETRALVKRTEAALGNKTNMPLDPYSVHEAMYYHLRDAERLAGEMGIISPLRWRLTYNESLGLNALVNGIDTENESYVSSKGLGMEIMDGFVGINVQHFEEEEEKVRKILWAT